MGAVYVADDTQLNRLVAIKIPKLQPNGPKDIIERLYIEARSAAQLQSPHICPVYDVGEIDGQHFISMAYIEGKSLADVLRSGSVLNERQILVLLRKVSLALHEAHQRGVVHRDLKPGNIMIDPRGEPVVMDFGLAFQTMEAARLTAVGQIVGSPAYMSPEQLQGNSANLTPAVDQYALGVVLYELLTAQLPFQGSITAIINQIISQAPPSPRLLRSDMDPKVDQLCQKLMSKQPDQRFASMLAVAELITEILKAKPATATPAEIPKVNTAPVVESVKDPQKNTQGYLDGIRTRVNAMIEKGELRDALDAVKGLLSLKNAEAVNWAREMQQQLVSKIRERKRQTDILSNLGAKLIREHDYAEAINVLNSIPASERTEEMQDLLCDAESKAEETKLLLDDIKRAIADEQPKELALLVKRFLQLKPGNATIRTLADDLKRYGAEKVIQIRRKQKNYFDPAPPLFTSGQLASAGAGVLALGLVCYFWISTYLVPRGTVVVEVQDPRISINFLQQEINQSKPGRFLLKQSDKQTLRVLVDSQPSTTREIGVANREIKRIVARMIDDELVVEITSDLPTFASPDNPSGELKAAEVVGDRTGELASGKNAASDPWIDLMAETSTAHSPKNPVEWNWSDKRLVGKITKQATAGWCWMTPERPITGDFDLEAEFQVVGSESLQVNLPLKETVGTLLIEMGGAALFKIDGKAVEWANNGPPYGNAKTKITPGSRQKIAASVRHAGDNVTIVIRVGDDIVCQFEGLRSRISTPEFMHPTKERLKLVTELAMKSPEARLEVYQCRIREQNLTSLEIKPRPAESAKPPVQPVKSNENSRVVYDADFTKSSGGFPDTDYDFMLTERKNGEFRYVGKKQGWWWNGIEPNLGRPENRHLDDFVIDFDYRMVGNKKGSFLVRFGLAQKDHLSLYVDQSGKVHLRGGADEILVSPVAPRNLKPTDQFNNVRLSVENKNVQVDVNGEKLFEKKLDLYVGESVRIWLAPDEVPFDVRLQRIRLETPKARKVRPTSRAIQTFVSHTKRVRGIEFLPGDEQAVSVGEDHAFKIWNVSTGGVIFDFEGHPAAVTSVSVSEDGRRALTGCADGMVRLWDMDARKLLKTLKGHATPVVKVIIARDGKTGLSTSDDGSIRRWDLKSGGISRIFSGPGTGTMIGISSDEKVVAAGNSGGQILIQSPAGGCPLMGHTPGNVNGIAFTPDNQKLVTASDDGTLRLWQLSDCKQTHRFIGEGAAFGTVSITNNGRYAIAGNIDGAVYGFDLQTGDTVCEIRSEQAVNEIIALSRNNRHVLTTGSADNKLYLWQLPKPADPN